MVYRTSEIIVWEVTGYGMNAHSGFYYLLAQTFMHSAELATLVLRFGIS